MQFLNPLFLIGSLALIAPILVHLVRRETARRVFFSSLMFVRRTSKASLRKQRLRHPLLLLLRMAALLLLVLAIARPLLTDPDAVGLSGSGGRSLVLLLDDSFSMRFGDRFGRAQSQARTILEGMGPGDRVQTVVFSDSTRLLNRPEANPREVGRLIDALEPGFSGTDYGPALRLADQILAGTPEGSPEIHWISDFQESGWQPGSPNVTIDERVELRTYPVAQAAGPNISIGRVTIQPEDRPSSRVTIAAEIRSRHLGQALDPALVLEINGQPALSRTVHLDANDSRLVRFESVAVPRGESNARLHLQFEDALPEDNFAYSSLSPPPRLKTLLLGTGRRDHYYLNRALTVSPDSSLDVTVAERGRIPLSGLSSYSAVILNNYGPVPAETASALIRFVESGGGLLLISGPQTHAENLGDLQEILPATLLKRYRAAGRGGDQRIGLLQKRHPIFNHFEEAHFSYFMGTAYTDFYLTEPLADSQVLAALQDGSPLLLERQWGKGRVLLFTSSLDRNWNPLPLKSVFLPFCQEMVKYVARFRPSPQAYRVGDRVALQSLNPRWAKALATLSTSGRSFAHTWTVVAPSGREIPLEDPAGGNRSSLKLTEPGFYRFRVQETENLLAANLDPRESDLRAPDPEQFLAQLPRAARREGTAPRKPASLDRRHALENRQHLWWYLVLTACLVLLVESLLANRYSSKATE
ncbi:MAG: VWA domain-containing protein [Acidobacteria bacterium]|nr:VWA domain-containing protein [Acidobacteriota bacterium]